MSLFQTNISQAQQLIAATRERQDQMMRQAAASARTPREAMNVQVGSALGAGFGTGLLRGLGWDEEYNRAVAADEAAKEQLRALQGLDLNNYNDVLSLANMYLQAGDVENARGLFDRARDIDEARYKQEVELAEQNRRAAFRSQVAQIARERGDDRLAEIVQLSDKVADQVAKDYAENKEVPIKNEGIYELADGTKEQGVTIGGIVYLANQTTGQLERAPEGTMEFVREQNININLGVPPARTASQGELKAALSAIEKSDLIDSSYFGKMTIEDKAAFTNEVANRANVIKLNEAEKGNRITQPEANRIAIEELNEEGVLQRESRWFGLRSRQVFNPEGALQPTPSVGQRVDDPDLINRLDNM